MIASLTLTNIASASIIEYNASSINLDIELDNGLGFGLNNLVVDISYNSTTWHSINSAKLSLLLSDDFDILDTEWADITTIENVIQPLIIAQEIDSNFPRYYFNIDVKDYLTIGAPDELSFLLHADRGDFEYHNARLTVDYNPLTVSTSVPEPTSIAILALGLLGLAGARKKKS